MLRSNRYRDNNNFIVNNEARCNDDIYAWEYEQHYSFLGFVQNAFWESDVYLEKKTVSTDGGLTTIETEDWLMLGIYFFAYENRNEYTRDVYNIVDILSEVGGLSTSIIFGMGLIGGLINSLFYQMHFVNLLYFDVETHNSGE